MSINTSVTDIEVFKSIEKSIVRVKNSMLRARVAAKKGLKLEDKVALFRKAKELDLKLRKMRFSQFDVGDKALTQSASKEVPAWKETGFYFLDQLMNKAS